MKEIVLKLQLENEFSCELYSEILSFEGVKRKHVIERRNLDVADLIVRTFDALVQNQEYLLPILLKIIEKCNKHKVSQTINVNQTVVVINENTKIETVLEAVRGIKM